MAWQTKNKKNKDEKREETDPDHFTLFNLKEG